MENLLLDFIKNVLVQHPLLTYVFFFISCLLQLVFPPFPSDVILIFQGYITTVSSSFSFMAIYINAMCGTLLGSYIVYKFGFVFGNKVFEFSFIKRYIDDKHRGRAEKLFKKYGPFAIFISKFLPGINALMILFSGILRMKSRKVLFPVAASVVIHHFIILILGRTLGDNIGYVKKLISTYNWIAVAFILLVGLLYFSFRLLMKYRQGWIKTSKLE
ncbi:MAG: DedA family protein [Clostridia bacterium]|nr:DedA family protein [Clostridia bacterium]